MTSSRPYLIRAMYEWIVDNGMTPYIVVNAKADNVQVPTDYIEDGKIILNISPQASRGLHLENDRIVFSARFSGQAIQIFTPPMAVLAIYAKENGKGMIFGEDDEGESGAAPVPGGETAAKPSGKKPSLKVIK